MSSHVYQPFNYKLLLRISPLTRLLSTDEETAEVHGIITAEGLFEGTISTALEDYHVEPVRRYLNSQEMKDPPAFHSIVYRASDVQDPRKGSYDGGLLCIYCSHIGLSITSRPGMSWVVRDVVFLSI